MSPAIEYYTDNYIQREAANLLSEDGENPEYDRGVIELVTAILHGSMEHKPEIEQTLRGMVRS